MSNTALAMHWYTLLRQSKGWVDRNGLAYTIEEMTPTYRRNCANWLVKHSTNIGVLYGIGEIEFTFSLLQQFILEDDIWGGDDALDEADRMRAEEPERWIATTPLYQALMRELPPDTPPQQDDIYGRRVKW